MALQKMKFDDVAIPFPSGFDVSEMNIQEEHQSEGGRTIIERVRQGVLNVNISTTAMSDILQVYKMFSIKDSFMFTLYEPLTGNQVTKTVFMDGFTYSLVEGSQDLEVTDGVYEIQCVLREF